MPITAVDLFCGVGGLTHGIQKTGINVVAGIDIEESCKFAYEENNQSTFLNRDINDLTKEEIEELYPQGDLKVLVGCAPCQPFSTYTSRYKKEGQKDNKWNLLYSFSNLIKSVQPEVVSMENVPSISKEKVFVDFVKQLEELNYYVSWKIVFCPDYGIPQRRKRLVLLASKIGELKLKQSTHSPEQYVSVREAISFLPPIRDGEVYEKDKLHRSSKLSAINLERIKQSKPGGTWRDWDTELLLACHKKSSGKSYPSVYGRMEWDKPSPTITTQFYGYGNGRFGHPEQNRALSLREGALLQTFPLEYQFFHPDSDGIVMKKIGTHIGNAVPVRLGEIIGQSIIEHLEGNL